MAEAGGRKREGRREGGRRAKGEPGGLLSSPLALTDLVLMTPSEPGLPGAAEETGPSGGPWVE